MELYGPHITVEFWGISNTLGLEHHILAGYDEARRYPWDDGAFPVASQKERNAAGFFVDPGRAETRAGRRLRGRMSEAPDLPAPLRGPKQAEVHERAGGRARRA